MKKIVIFLVCICITTVMSAKELLFSTAYDLAIKNSNQLHSKEYSHYADKELINQEKSGLYPQINLSAYYKKTNYYSNPSDKLTKQGLFNYTVSLKQTIYNANNYSRIDLQKLRSKYSKVELELQKQYLAKDIFKAYLDVLKSKSKIASLQAYLKYQDSKLKALQKQYNMKLVNQMDLLEMKVQYNSSLIDLNKEKRLFDVYNLRLKYFIESDKYKIPTINIDKNISLILTQMKNAVSKDIDSLEVKKVEVASKLSYKMVENAYDAYMPTVSFDASYSKYKTDTPTIEAPYNHIESAMININIPIFNGGYTSSRVQVAKLKYNAAQEDILSTKKKINVAYHEDLINFNTALNSVFLYKKAYKSAKLFVEASNQGYLKGLKSIVDLNNAKAKMYNIKYKYIDNLYTMIDAYIAILIETNKLKDIKFLDQLIKGNFK